GGRIRVPLSAERVARATHLHGGHTVSWKSLGAQGTEFALAGPAPSPYASVIVLEYKGAAFLTPPAGPLQA
ncbi:MAG: hypothetical protein M1541_05860, partial [Acidobacteria bacterium]|nr:hypothetical protein [Acidobacteriota bacterium]